jgi:RND family efflux transporter MFP subunit
VIFAAVGLNACSAKGEQKNESLQKPIGVVLSVPSSGLQTEILASGTIEAAQTASISTRVMGRITNIYVKTGDKVVKGQLLARVWDEDIRAKRAQADAMIAEAEGAYVSAQKDHERFTNLYKQQSATAKELDNVVFQYNSAKARLNAAKQMKNEVNAMLFYSSLTAPFAGVVIQKLAEEGSIASPGMPILTLEQDGILRVSASIAESDIADVRLGDIATVTVKSTGNAFEGKIIQVNPSSQLTHGQYVVKISVPEIAKKDVYSGMFTSVSIPLKEKHRVKSDAVLVPASAIVKRDELTGIYTVSATNTAMLRWVRLGKSLGDKVEIIAGLSKNEKFISSSESKLYSGAPVKEIRKTTKMTAALQ